MKTYEWETINDDLFMESGEKEFVSVTSEKPYMSEMNAQNKRVLKYLQEKYPDRTFRISKWHPHDFGSYQEVEEQIAYEEDDE